MTALRQRMLDTFHFNHPDKIPVVYHPSPAGLYVHGQKLLDLFNAYPPDNPIVFDRIPTPPPGTVDAEGRYHESAKDGWGVEWEYLIFGVAGHPKTYPFVSWEASTDYTFPPLPSADARAFDAQRQMIARQHEHYLVFGGSISIFEKLHALRPIDTVLMDLCVGDRALLAFIERLVDYWLAYINDLIALGVDVIMFGDDWGAQTAPLVSPALFRRIFVPHYRRMFELVKRAGKKVFFHSCGFLGPIFDDLLALGIDGLWPQIGLYEQLPNAVEKCREHRVTIYIHPDRQRLIPLGTPQEIVAAIRGYAEHYHALGGGGIFYIEIENDAPFENVKALIEAVDTYR
jgi:uroporphyrinogen decarboxylase